MLVTFQIKNKNEKKKQKLFLSTTYSLKISKAKLKNHYPRKPLLRKINKKKPKMYWTKKIVIFTNISCRKIRTQKYTNRILCCDSCRYNKKQTLNYVKKSSFGTGLGQKFDVKSTKKARKPYQSFIYYNEFYYK